jgi:hypothetical protein
MGLLGVVINGADIDLNFEEPISHIQEDSDILNPEEYSTGVHRN